MNLAVSPKRVLVIDDNRDSADLIAELLAMYGWVTRVAYGGRPGIAAAIEFEPDVIFLDLGMPEMNGFVVASTLRAMALVRRPVLIAYSAWGDAATRQKTQDCGFDRHLVKPASLEDILDSVSMAAPAP